MPELTPDQIRESREQLLDTIDRLNDLLLNEGTVMSADQIQTARRAIRQLNNGVVELTAKAIQGTGAELGNAVDGVKKATAEANRALDTLSDLRHGIDVATALVGLGTAIAAGNPVGIVGAAQGVVQAAAPLVAGQV